jgi:hypothetical protein
LIAAAGGGFGGLLAGGAALAAAAAGGGGGGGGTAGVAPSGQTGRLLEGATNDTGVSSSDSYTSNQNPVYRGVAEKGAEVELTVNGVVYKTTASSTDGSFSVPLTNNGQVLADGVYTPTIKVTNTAGSSTVNGTPFTVDHKADKNQDDTKTPTEVDDNNNTSSAITITSIDDSLNTTNATSGSKDTGLSSSDFITSDGTLNFSGTVTNFTTNGDVVHIQVVNANGGLIVDQYVTPDSTGKWTFNNQANKLADGAYTIKASIEDKAGNSVKTATNVPLVIDSNPDKNQPSDQTDANKNAGIAIGSIDDGTSGNAANGSKDTGRSKSDFVTSDGSLNFNGTVTTDFISNGDVVHVQVVSTNGVIEVDQYVTPDSTGKWTFNNQAETLTDGTYTIKAAIEDKAGNIVKTATNVTLVIDSKADTNQPSDQNDPNKTSTISIGGIDDGSSSTTTATGSKDTGVSNNDLITTDATLKFKGTLANFTLNEDQVHLQIVKIVNGVESVAVDTYVAPSDISNWTFDNTDPDKALSPGTYKIKAALEDRAGNVISSATPRDLVIEATNPSPINSVLSITSIDQDTGSNDNDFLTSDNKLTVGGATSLPANSTTKIFVEIFSNSSNTVVRSGYATLIGTSANPSWTFVVDADSGSTTLADGSYKIRAVYQTPGGAPLSTPVEHDLRVANATPILVANNDNQTVTEGNNLTTSATSGVLANDGDSAVATLAVTKVGKNTGALATVATSETVMGEFGQLELFADGHYVYTPDGHLVAGAKGTDTFTYEVTATSGRKATANLVIEVTGVNDQATVALSADNTGPITINGSTTFANQANPLTITDKDTNEAVILGLNTTGNTTANGVLGTLTMTSKGSGAYGFSYERGSPTVGTNLTKHDLFSFTSKDGTDNETLDFQLQGSDGTAVSKQEFNLAPLGAETSVTGVKAIGSGTTEDTLILRGSSNSGTTTTFDLSNTANTTLTSIEKIDVQGAGTNVIKLSLANLIQGDTSNAVSQKLFVHGDSNDQINFKTTITATDNGTKTVDGVSYHSFNFGNDELLIQTAITSVTFNG